MCTTLTFFFNGEKRGQQDSGGLKGLCDLALASQLWGFVFSQAVPGFLALQQEPYSICAQPHSLDC